MSKVEEVARAINACFDQPSPRITAAMPDAEMRSIISEQFARAAIEAMREPTLGMQSAALPYVMRQHQTRDVFRAMIDAALNEVTG